MAWSHLPHQQQRGAQPGSVPQAAPEPLGGERGNDGSAPAEAVAGREAQGNKYADLDLSSSEPQRDIDYPATDPEGRKGDISPTGPDSIDQGWDDVVQPEGHARQVGGPSTARRSSDAGDGGPDGAGNDEDQPLPEGY